MILHCYYCALGGDHPTEASQVAIVDNLHKPLTADMFRPLRPEHDPSPPFQSDEWRYMLHRACGKYPWPYDVDPVSGPSRILTDKGMVEIPLKPLSEQSMNFEITGMEISPDGKRMTLMRNVKLTDTRSVYKVPVEIIDEFSTISSSSLVGIDPLPITRAEKADRIVKLVREQNMPTCGDCGKRCKSNAGLVSHMRTHK